MNHLNLLIILYLFAAPLSANQKSDTEELEKWFYNDTVTTTKEVNESQLVFLKSPPMKPTLHSINSFIIDGTSINDGWVKLTQCYENLDAVPVAEVVFQYRFMRHLKIKSSRNIQQVAIKNQSVQLEEIKKNARLCITAEVRNFYQNQDKTFSLVNGPYHRKFLDGYYPYHLSMDIKFSKRLHFMHSSPKKQKGYVIKEAPNRLIIDSWFEGKLNTELRFKLIN